VNKWSHRNWWSFEENETMNLKYSMKMMLKKSSANQNQHISRIPKCARCRNHGIIRWSSRSLNSKSWEDNVDFPQWTQRTQKVLHLQELPMSKVWFDLRTPKDNGSAGNGSFFWELKRMLKRWPRSRFSVIETRILWKQLKWFSCRTWINLLVIFKLFYLELYSCVSRKPK
jgi:hypothetical protein